MTSEQRHFTSADVDRLLGLADEFLDDWVIKAFDDDLDDAKQRKAEWEALRPKILSAWRATEQLLYGYARAQFRGGMTDWADIDTAFDLALGEMRPEYLTMGVEAARAIFDVSDWQVDAAAGNTLLGYQDWLVHKAEEELL